VSRGHSESRSIDSFARLFGRHIGERAGDKFGGLHRLALAGEARRDSEPSEPHLAGCEIRKYIGRLNVLVDKPAIVQPANGDRQGNAKVQERLQPPLRVLTSR